MFLIVIRKILHYHVMYLVLSHDVFQIVYAIARFPHRYRRVKAACSYQLHFISYMLCKSRVISGMSVMIILWATILAFSSRSVVSPVTEALKQQTAEVSRKHDKRIREPEKLRLGKARNPNCPAKKVKFDQTKLNMQKKADGK